MSSQVWTILEMVRWTTEYLAGKGMGEPRLNAEILLAETLGLKRLDLYLQFDRPLQPAELDEYRSRLRRRARHEPLQYIAGFAHFRELRLRVDRRVLIPRPETELLVGEVLAWSADRAAPSAIDVGTGSGAIALSLATEGSFGRMVGVDLSAGALEVARVNQREAAAGAPVDFRLGSLFDAVGDERFDVVVSNPPYVGERERESLDPQVREWEPPEALFSGAEGIDLIDQLVRRAPDHLLAGGLLALEIGAEQGRAVAALVRATGAFSEPRVRPDLAGRDRIVLADRR